MLYHQHIPVLTAEIVDLFRPTPTDTLLDATLGTGGHALAYLIASKPGGTVVGLDADAKAIATAKHYLAAYQDRVTFLTANFAFLKDSLIGGGILDSAASHPSAAPSIAPDGQSTPPSKVNKNTSHCLFTHILFDLGIGSHQLDDPTAGFSFQCDGPLNMKFGMGDKLPASSFQCVNYATQRLGHLPTAYELIARLSVPELTLIIRTLGEEKYAGRIAQAIKQQLPSTTQELSTIIAQAVPAHYEHGRINPATRTFQALRLAVNRELEALAQGLPQAADLLAENGTIAVISFHSLEDRIVKQYFRQSSLSLVTKKPITATANEIKSNPRSRTAKLRVARRKPG
jgi:16S rRNA (cytosine1402-N4)-methyltransferase